MRCLGKIRLLAILACTLLGGCLFAPAKYGPRGCVGPESEQYQKYLANCRSKSSQLEAACRQRGNPELIEIGNSGGYFLWRHPMRLLIVRSFGRTSEAGYIPFGMKRALARREDARNSNIESRRVRSVAVATQAVEPVVQVLSLDYDADARRGKMAVKFAAGHYAEARRYVRSNVETLAKDKNVALTTGQIPVAAKFYLGDEIVKDGCVLEVEFETE